jgi:hypothetical protein
VGWVGSVARPYSTLCRPVAIVERCGLSLCTLLRSAAWVDATAQGIISARLIVKMAEALGGVLPLLPDVVLLRREAVELAAYMRAHM